MEIALALLFKLIPLYFVIFLGYIAGRFLRAQKATLASLLVYIISPLVIFHGVVTTTLDASALSLPIFFFTACCVLSSVFLAIGSRLWRDSTKNILAFTAGTGNTGYFGLPVALALFNEEVVGTMVFSILGFVLYENSLGFFIAARRHH